MSDVKVELLLAHKEIEVYKKRLAVRFSFFYSFSFILTIFRIVIAQAVNQPLKEVSLRLQKLHPVM